MGREQLILLSSAIILCCVGCTKQQQVSTEVATEEQIIATETVSLPEIAPPKFNEDFATIECDGKFMSVVWGADGTNVMWKESGFPGFGYPMVVQINDEPSSCEATITTSWGHWKYVPVSSGFAYLQSDNLIDADSGKVLINWGVSKETLILWNEESLKYVEYEYSGGTKIVE